MALSGAESYEELEARSQKIRQILSKSDSFRSDTPMNVFHGGDRAMFRMPGRVGAFLTPDAHESGIMVAFKLKEVRFREHARELMGISMIKKLGLKPKPQPNNVMSRTRPTFHIPAFGSLHD